MSQTLLLKRVRVNAGDVLQASLSGMMIVRASKPRALVGRSCTDGAGI